MAETLTRAAIVAAPSSEPLTTAEAKSHLDIPADDSTHDPFVSSLITAARQTWERDTDRIVMSSTCVEKLDAWPGEAIELLKQPVASVTSIQYVDSNGNTQTWAGANYSLDLYRVRPTIYPAYDVDWPTVRSQRNAITITYVVGYASAAAVPKQWKQAMLLLIGHWFENRSAVNIGNITTEIPQSYERLVANWQRSTYP